jgi:hypothetical protein
MANIKTQQNINYFNDNHVQSVHNLNDLNSLNKIKINIWKYIVQMAWISDCQLKKNRNAINIIKN